MSETPQSGPGWWQASDGKWYPPHLHPDYSAHTDQLQPTAPAQIAQPRSRGPLIAVVSVVVLFIAAGVGVGLYMATKASALGPGSGTATITWSTANAGSNSASGSISNPPPQPFAGNIEGIAVSGTSTFIIPTNVSLGQSSLPLQRYTGTFDGKDFNLKATATSLPTASSSSNGSSPNTKIVVDGMWGSDQVHAVVTQSATSPNSNTADFHGTVGQWTVTGTITGPTNSANIARATASFTVSQ